LFFLDARLTPDTVKSGSFDLAGLLASLELKVAEMGATRIVFDSIGVLLSLMEDPATERQELYRVHDWLARSGLTGIITSRLEGKDLSTLQSYDFLQFMGDCVIVLHHRLEDRVSLRELRVVKYRGSRFSENVFPMVIGTSGISVGSFGQAPSDYHASSERISTGIARLDAMLEGGYFRGSSTLISGAPGTAKSSLAAAFVATACQRGERGLYVSFDEAPNEIIRNLGSIGIQLEPFVEAGCLRIESIRSDARSSEEHLFWLKKFINEQKPSCLVVDPISAMLKAGGLVSALSVTQRLLHYAKQQGVTILFTSLLEGNHPELEATQIQISTIADTWIHLSYLIQSGERNRALTVIKSRGTAHSNQVRELILSSEGLTLEEVYKSGGAVLMGTLRWEKEVSVAMEEERRRVELEHKRREFKATEGEISARIEMLRNELEAKRVEMAALDVEYAELEQSWLEQQEGRRSRRNPKDGTTGLSEPTPEHESDLSNQGKAGAE
jgi:circadian clock protein KaiC